MCCISPYTFLGADTRQGALQPRREASPGLACSSGASFGSSPSADPWAGLAQGHKIPQGWKSTHKFVGAFMRDLQRAEDTPPLALGSAKTVRDLKKRAENIVSKVIEHLMTSDHMTSDHVASDHASDHAANLEP